MQVGEMARDAAPSADDQALGGRVAAQKIVGQIEGRRGQRDALLAAVPVGALVLPQPDVVDVGIGGQKLVEARLEKFTAGVGRRIEARTAARIGGAGFGRHAR